MEDSFSEDGIVLDGGYKIFLFVILSLFLSFSVSVLKFGEDARGGREGAEAAADRDGGGVLVGGGGGSEDAGGSDDASSEDAGGGG